jgi:release factor glutamine methyltransferase
MSLKYVESASKYLKKFGISNSYNEAERLFSHCMGFNNLIEWYRSDEKMIGNEMASRFRKWIIRRAYREPFDYIIGSKEFYGRKFMLNSSCLIPRPETELLVDVVKETLYNRDGVDILELGTGSGCISISLLKELPIPRMHVTITDISRKALDIAWDNAKFWNVTDQMIRGKGSWFNFNHLDDVHPCERLYDMIISNPPYLSQRDMISRMPELTYEPIRALYGGKDGLHAYRQIAKGARVHLKSQGQVIVEIGAYQHKKVQKIFEFYGFKLQKEFKDLQSISRVLIFG